jgi:predicted MPP superfamily phosphohydrolase
MIPLLAGLAPAAPDGMAFTVSIPQPAAHTLHVSFRCKGLKGELQDFKMPVWSPGYYGVGDYSRNASNFRAEDVNILLSHNPDTFPRAAELGIDLSLAGHTHGGQAALEFISPEIAPSRLVTPYAAGWFKKPGGQLYVNRGIGTIFIPMRVGAPPEITVYSLSRGGEA